MNFGLAIYTMKGASAMPMIAISEQLKVYLKNKEYGEAVSNLAIGVVLFDPKYNEKERRPKYYEGKHKITTDGISVEIENTLEFDCRIHIDTYLASKEPKALVAQSILESLKTLVLPKKVKDFDLKLFLFDLERFFEDEKIIPPSVG